MPKFLLSDWCADAKLIDAGGVDVMGVYLLHPMKAADFRKDGNALWGKRAYSLLAQLIEEADSSDFHSLAGEGWPVHYLHWLLGLHRVANSRNALRLVMERWRWRKEVELVGETYKFDQDGIGITTPFRVWQVKTVDDKANFVDFEN